ncbi:MAG: cytochrome c biogenesis protein CcsA, partial [Thermodesulfobacteriota bacterium]
VICHTVLLVNFVMKGDVSGGASRSLLIFSWLVVIVFLISQIKFVTPVIGAFISPVAFIGTFQSIIIPSGIIAIDPSLNNPWILIHIILIFLGEAFFSIAFISGLIYIFEENQLKSKKITNYLKKLPSLTTLDRINHFSLLLGFPFLTVGLAIGHIMAKEIWGESWIWGAKETWSTVTWLLYAFLINGRLSSGWKGKKSALGAVIGFAIIVITFLIGYVTPGQHRFG